MELLSHFRERSYQHRVLRDSLAQGKVQASPEDGEVQNVKAGG